MSLGGFLSNESFFGRLMTKCGTIIMINVLFAVSCIPFFTMGAALAALYGSVFAMLHAEEEDRIHRNGSDIQPLRVYVREFRKHFVKATLCWLAFTGVMLLGGMNLTIIGEWSGWMRNLSAGVIAVMAVAVTAAVFWFPVEAERPGRLAEQLRLVFLIIMEKPLRSAAVLVLNVVPVALIVLDEVNRPTYGFIGTFFGFAVTACITARLLKPAFDRYSSVQ